MKIEINKASETTKGLISILGFDYEIYEEGTPYNDIISAYHNMFEMGLKEGFTPIMVPSFDILLEMIMIIMDRGYSYKMALDNDLEPAQEVFDKLYKDATEDVFDEESLEELYMDCGLEGECEGLRFIAIADYETNYTEETIIFKIPTTKPWEVVAYIPFSDFFLSMPELDEMLSCCKHWYEKYNAIPAVIAGNALEFYVKTPPKKEDTFAIAKEHFSFCPECIEHGTETQTLSERALIVESADIWSFWWDSFIVP